jgi:hypothetical protein
MSTKLDDNQHNAARHCNKVRLWNTQIFSLFAWRRGSVHMIRILSRLDRVEKSS